MDDVLNVADSYRTLWRITSLRPIRLLALVLLTAKVCVVSLIFLDSQSLQILIFESYSFFFIFDKSA